MTMVFQCDRCGKTSSDYEVNQREGPLPPAEWREMYVPVRGSEGARSSRKGTICETCDDDLYEWFHQKGNK